MRGARPPGRKLDPRVAPAHAPYPARAWRVRRRASRARIAGSRAGVSFRPPPRWFDGQPPSNFVKGEEHDRLSARKLAYAGKVAIALATPVTPRTVNVSSASAVTRIQNATHRDHARRE